MKDIKDKRFLIACSGGPDSMALLDMYKDKCYVEVAHVNYHKRDSALRDEKIVRAFCKKYHIRFHLLDVYPDDVKGNFQDYARNVRYAYFKKLVDKNKLDAVLVAHHLDDLIETYLLQEEKKIGVSYYGINKFANIKDVLIIRPLLKYQKSYLKKYCDDNKIPYGIDESNLTNHYARNKIRHNVVEKMTYKEKLATVKMINSLNVKQHKELIEVNKFMTKDRYSIDEFVNYEYFDRLIRCIFDENLSLKFVCDIKNKLINSNHVVIKRNGIYLVKEYDYIEFFKEEKDYNYRFNKIEYGDYEHFKISNRGSRFDGAYISKDDFPIVIRNYREGDHIKMRYGTKKINRFFIDKKISLRERLCYPVVENRVGELILVPGIGCNFSHFSDKYNVYVIKF